MDFLGPFVPDFFFFPLSIMLTAGSHVVVRDADEVFLAGFKVYQAIEEFFDLVNLVGSSTASLATLLRNLLSKPDSLRDAVVPHISLKHDSAHLFLRGLLLFQHLFFDLAIALFLISILLHRYVSISPAVY